MKEDKGEERDVDIQLIHDNIICRYALNQKRSDEFVEMMLNGEKFPRIKVVPDGSGGYTVQDGRTRLNAYDRVGEKMIPVLVLHKKSDVEILLAAFKDNFGQSAPMSRDDAIHTIAKLMEMGMARKDIIERMPYGKSMVVKLYTLAITKRHNQRCAKTIELMQQNPKMSLEEAARYNNITAQDIITYQKSFMTKSTTCRRSTITNKFNSLSNYMGGTLSSLMKQYHDGEVTPIQTLDLIKEFRRRIEMLLTNQLDWENRFDKAIGPLPASVAPEAAYVEEKIKAGVVLKPNSKK